MQKLISPRPNTKEGRFAQVRDSVDKTESLQHLTSPASRLIRPPVHRLDEILETERWHSAMTVSMS